jgi:uncharacterized protein
VDTPAKPLIEYPTEYAFKVIGRREAGFAELVGSLFASVLGDAVPEGAITENVSKQGTYIALTVSIVLRSEEDRQAIYQRLHCEKRVLYSL